MSRHPNLPPFVNVGKTTNDPTEIERRPSEELIKQTLAVWQPRVNHTLTEEDARQIVENAVGFFRLLQEWNLEARKNRLISLRVQQRTPETPPMKPGKIVWRRRPVRAP
jgi:hypothetical protein